MGKKFLNFCDDNHIRVDWSAVFHPKTNGQVERANDMILQGLKPRIFKRLDKFRERWVAELPSVLWSLRTTPSRATRFSPSSWCTALRRSYPPTSTTTARGCEHTPKKETKSRSRM
jgi:lambda repressor-like predicted transcriptional regulator